MSEPDLTKPYQASGGPSELRSYADGGEGLTIEAHKHNYALAWSADASATKFLDAVQGLVGTAVDVQLSPSTNGHDTISIAEATAIVKKHPKRIKFIAVDGPGESFTWLSGDTPVTERYLKGAGEVGVIFSALNQNWIESLIKTTATRHVKLDMRGILASAQRLTQPPSSASAK